MGLARILVGDDGSSGAAAAVAWAKSLADAASAEVTSVHVSEAGRLSGSDIAGGVREATGHPTARLLAIADEIDADLTVVGRRGAGGFEALRLGSVSHQLAEHTRRPLVVVPEAIQARTGGWPFATIAIGLDGSASGQTALSWTTELAREATAEVVVVHAVDFAPQYAVGGLEDSYEKTRTSITAFVEDWTAPLREARVVYSTLIVSGGPVGVLLEAIDVHHVGLLVVGRGTGSLAGMSMGSVAHRALGFAPCPTIVVPPLN